jgi:hypothetical protein
MRMTVAAFGVLRNAVDRKDTPVFFEDAGNAPIPSLNEEIERLRSALLRQNVRVAPLSEVCSTLVAMNAQ